METMTENRSDTKHQRLIAWVEEVAQLNLIQVYIKLIG